MRSLLSILKRFRKEHMPAILMGCLLALLAVSPHIRAWSIVGHENFEGVYPAFNDDEVAYQARIKEVVDGHITIGNPYIKEHMNDSFIMPPLAEWVIAFFVWVTGASVPFITSVSDGVLGFINFILVYILFLTITQGNKRISLFYTSIFFIFSLSTFGRPISPQFNILFLFFGLICISRIYFSESVKNSRVLHLGAGLITGISCFISPYYFSTLLAFYTLASFSRAFFERSIQSVRQNTQWFFIAFLPLALLYAYVQIKASSDPSYSEIILRYGLMHTHIPGSFTNMMFGGLALGIVVVCYKVLSLRNLGFCLASIVTIFAINWQNIITGKSLQFSSHYLFVTILLVFFVLAIVQVTLVTEGKKIFPKHRMILGGMGILFVLIVIGHNQIGEYSNIAKMPYSTAELFDQQKKMHVFNWLNENTPSDSVVYTLGNDYDFLIPVYTKNKVFYNFYASLYPASNSETEERWLIQHLFDEDMSTTTIRDLQRDFWGNRFIDIYQSTENQKKIIAKLTGNTYVPAPMIAESDIAYMLDRWVKVKAKPIAESLAQYEIDFILVSPEYPYFDEALQKLEALHQVSFITEINGNWIYKFEG